MTALRKLAESLFPGVFLQDKPLPAPEPAFACGRKVVGLRALLTKEQRERSLSYKGDESFGDVACHSKASA
jgi:hypothetical protein